MYLIKYNILNYFVSFSFHHYVSSVISCQLKTYGILIITFIFSLFQNDFFNFAFLGGFKM